MCFSDISSRFCCACQISPRFTGHRPISNRYGFEWVEVAGICLSDAGGYGEAPADVLQLAPIGGSCTAITDGVECVGEA